MTPDGVYIRILGGTKAPHWLPHFVPDTLLLQEIAYEDLCEWCGYFTTQS